MIPAGNFDLIVLAADKDIEQSVRGILSDHARIGIRAITYDVIVHPEHDPGVLKRPQELLRSMIRRAGHALAIFDYEGCGQTSSREEVERIVEQRLLANGWDGRAAAISIDPELENWLGICIDSRIAASILGWPVGGKSFRDYLIELSCLRPGQRRLNRPKEALRAALRVAKVPKSSSLYFKIAIEADIERCTDASFEKLVRFLRLWFPSEV